MNLPNILTVIRVIMAPLFLAVILADSIPHYALIALLVFIAACITDYLDGNIARKKNMITDFGKFLDPLADKMLTTAAFLAFMDMGLCSIWIIMIVLTREFLVTSVRLAASSSGKVVAASIWGKLKTVIQMVAIIAVLAMVEAGNIGILPADFPYSIVSNVLFWISTFFTVVSGIQYVYDNKDFIKVK